MFFVAALCRRRPSVTDRRYNGCNHGFGVAGGVGGVAPLPPAGGKVLSRNSSRTPALAGSVAGHSKPAAFWMVRRFQICGNRGRKRGGSSQIRGASSGFRGESFRFCGKYPEIAAMGKDFAAGENQFRNLPAISGLSFSILWNDCF
jgi:hypothetical protein